MRLWRVLVARDPCFLRLNNHVLGVVTFSSSFLPFFFRWKVERGTLGKFRSADLRVTYVAILKTAI